MTEPLPIVLVPGLLTSPRVYAAQLSALWQHGPVTIADNTRGDTMAAIDGLTTSTSAGEVSLSASAPISRPAAGYQLIAGAVGPPTPVSTRTVRPWALSSVARTCNRQPPWAANTAGYRFREGSYTGSDGRWGGVEDVGVVEVLDPIQQRYHLDPADPHRAQHLRLPASGEPAAAGHVQQSLW